MAKILFVRSSWDLASAYLHAYTGKLVDYVRNETGHRIIADLEGDLATFANFDSYMHPSNPADKPYIVIIAGHGAANLVTGQDMEPLITQNVNDDITKGDPTFLWACSTGKSLGKAMWEKGTPEFYGYMEDFTFIVHTDKDGGFDYESRPLEDPWAQGLFESALATGYSILADTRKVGARDLTAKDVFDNTMKRYDYYWDFWLQQNNVVADDILTWLNWNRENFVAIAAGLGTEPEVYRGVSLTTDLSGLILPVVAGAALLFLVTR